MSDLARHEEAAERLRVLIREVRPGGCHVLSDGVECTCPLCDIDALVRDPARRPETAPQVTALLARLKRRDGDLSALISTSPKDTPAYELENLEKWRDDVREVLAELAALDGRLRTQQKALDEEKAKNQRLQASLALFTATDKVTMSADYAHELYRVLGADDTDDVVDVAAELKERAEAADASLAQAQAEIALLQKRTMQLEGERNDWRYRCQSQQAQLVALAKEMRSAAPGFGRVAQWADTLSGIAGATTP